jgi:hypothetical protein
MSGQKDNSLKMMENKAEELVSLTLEVCERRLSSAHASLTPPQAALSAAAMTVHHSVETFLAVTKIPDQAGGK